ncbi:hypothetical protein AY599_09845 [Leptolyngbya valderiana BDU 20041]|nr:PilN domain-containing protein [Geitlerinema sp. CS-897]OAB60949.1 hypothetical protein AY599_09845 [Leptolyngbya valderiana BDU 20041]PPT08350.1 Type IV pilus biogenesis protein PilN [Geitlerinema sp. FC II]
MYSIDINFLNDRPEYRPESTIAPTGERRSIEVPGKAVLIAGSLVAVAFLGAVGGAFVYLKQFEIPRLEGEIADLDAELSSYLQKEQQYKQIQQETQQIKDQTQALAGVFNYITPWSALLQDLRDRQPTGIRISGIEQIEYDPGRPPSGLPAPEPTETGRPPSLVTITGIAKSFSDVNDFVVVLQESSLFKGSATQLVSAEMTDYPARSQTYDDNASGSLEFEQIVEFQVVTQIREVPATEILQELQRKGALGLVNRIQQLQSRGVI